MLHDYQQHRIMMLLDPSQDALGKGYHTIQGMIAVGSGGILGKGYLNGTQTHLDFLPERTTDFIFAVYSEEFGLLGNIILLGMFLFVIGRGFIITANASTYFTRLMAGSITLTFFTYAFVNMGMVSGILPVVGVPLPLVSYGGTSMVTLLLGFGMLMSITHAQDAGTNIRELAMNKLLMLFAAMILSACSGIPTHQVETQPPFRWSSRNPGSSNLRLPQRVTRSPRRRLSPVAAAIWKATVPVPMCLPTSMPRPMPYRTPNLCIVTPIARMSLWARPTRR